MRHAWWGLLLLSLSCSGDRAPESGVSQRHRDSVLGASGLPGAGGVRGALGAADAAAARSAAADSISQDAEPRP